MANEDDATRMPRWVKIVGAAAVVLVVLLIVALLSGHGPGRHMGGHGASAPLTAVDGVAGWLR
ncbi:hypothetical protein OHA72_26735 [Dactylosporangium sp. NBC_01737]|uniref:hypothetical protein n=1 Tax=Dactylosporangium sp. NBC_01737 TaxID=2975959 RepID=UPI002E13EEC4|nr:hypothetical protein OHA72_26735 [Dactylosporangium sp. NBC_01737]